MVDRSDQYRVTAGLPKVDEVRAARRHGGTGQVQTRQFAIDAARLLHDLHCQDVMLLDVRGLSDVTDYVLIASGTSDRQIKSVAGDVEKLAKGHDMHRYGRDVDDGSTWLVLDFIDMIVHFFEPVTRAHYDLEMMWGDAPQIPWQRP